MNFPTSIEKKQINRSDWKTCFRPGEDFPGSDISRSLPSSFKEPSILFPSSHTIQKGDSHNGKTETCRMS